MIQEIFDCHGNRTIAVLVKVTVLVKMTVLKIYH